MKNKAKMDLNIQEITYINEMALTIGLYCWPLVTWRTMGKWKLGVTGMGSKRNLGIDKYHGICICNSRSICPSLREMDV
jgi:hypothetical protein